MKKRDVKELRTPEPKIKTATPPEPATRETPGSKLEADRARRPHLYWKKDDPRPVNYPRRHLTPFLPCDRCDRVKTDFGTRAVVCDSGTSASQGKAYLRCRCCGFTFAMALEPE